MAQTLTSDQETALKALVDIQVARRAMGLAQEQLRRTEVGSKLHLHYTARHDQYEREAQEAADVLQHFILFGVC